MSLIDVAVDAGVARVMLNDAERRNILSGALVRELVAAFDELETDSGVSAVVVTGSGPVFCAGADLADLQAATRGDVAGVELVYEGFLRVARSTLPTIAAVNGPAVGAGFNLALACDLRVVSASAWFDTRFLKLGIHPGGGHTWMLHRLVGPQVAAAMVLFGERLDGATAVAAGLAYQCVPDEELSSAVATLTSRLGSVEPELVRRTKQTLRLAGDGRDHAAVLAHETAEQMWSLSLPSTASRITR
jgi:enoyl-CoA hydratase